MSEETKIIEQIESILKQHEEIGMEEVVKRLRVIKENEEEIFRGYILRQLKIYDRTPGTIPTIIAKMTSYLLSDEYEKTRSKNETNNTTNGNNVNS